MDESWTLKRCRIFFPQISSKIVSPVHFKEKLTWLHVCVSQVGVLWLLGLSAYSPCSWWPSSAWTSECSAIFVFASHEEEDCYVADACKDVGTLSTIVWFDPVTPDIIFQFLISGICLWKKTHKWKNWKWTKTSLIYPQKASLEEWQRSSVNFLNMPYVCLHLSLTVTCLKMDHSWKCKHYSLHRLDVLSFYIMKPTFLI